MIRSTSRARSRRGTAPASRVDNAGTCSNTRKGEQHTNARTLISVRVSLGAACTSTRKGEQHSATPLRRAPGAALPLQSRTHLVSEPSTDWRERSKALKRDGPAPHGPRRTVSEPSYPPPPLRQAISNHFKMSIVLHTGHRESFSRVLLTRSRAPFSLVAGELRGSSAVINIRNEAPFLGGFSRLLCGFNGFRLPRAVMTMQALHPCLWTARS